MATAVAALAGRGDREEMPQADAEAVKRAVRWLQSPVCTNAIAETSPLPQESRSHMDGDVVATSLLRANAWRMLALAVLAPTGLCMPTNGPDHLSVTTFDFDRQSVFDAKFSARLATALQLRLGGWSEAEVRGHPADPALAFIAATFNGRPPADELKPLMENLASAWNEGSPAVWLSNPEAGWWLARAVNGATGDDLPLPPDAEGRVRNVNWRGIMAGKWINSQRIDREGNGHWDGDAEKTAFAVLLLNEM